MSSGKLLLQTIGTEHGHRREVLLYVQDYQSKESVHFKTGDSWF